VIDPKIWLLHKSCNCSRSCWDKNSITRVLTIISNLQSSMNLVLIFTLRRVFKLSSISRLSTRLHVESAIYYDVSGYWEFDTTWYRSFRNTKKQKLYWMESESFIELCRITLKWEGGNIFRKNLCNAVTINFT